MNRQLTRDIFRTAKTTALYIVAAGVALTIIFPVYFLVSMSLMSDFEVYDEWPLPMVPSLRMRLKLEPSAKGFLLSVKSRNTGEYRSITETDDLVYLRDFIRRKTNCRISQQELQKKADEARTAGASFFVLGKDIILNYSLFFKLKTEAWPGLLRSLYTAATTILISLTIGGLGGYAFARYIFTGKNLLKLSVLFVRMFPAVATAIPAAIILGNMGLYDRPLGLSFIYSIGSIGLTIWITASIFMSIPVALEEAAMIFGTTKIGAFWHVTLPLALPGLAACAMYASLSVVSEIILSVVGP